MRRFIQVQSDSDLDRLLAAAWRLFYPQRLTEWSSYAQRLTVDPIYASAGRPVAVDGMPLDWSNPRYLEALRRGASRSSARAEAWVWNLRACPRVFVEPTPGGGALVLLDAARRDPDGWSLLERQSRSGALLEVPSDGDLVALRSVSSLHWKQAILSGEEPAQRARLQLGHAVIVSGSSAPTAINPAAQRIEIQASEFRGRDQLTGKWLMALQRAEAPSGGPQ